MVWDIADRRSTVMVPTRCTSWLLLCYSPSCGGCRSGLKAYTVLRSTRSKRDANDNVTMGFFLVPGTHASGGTGVY